MKNRNTQLTAILFVLAFALVPIVQAARGLTVVLSGRPLTRRRGLMVALSAWPTTASVLTASPDGENRPVITIHSTDSVKRGKTGSFVLDMHPLMFGGMYVNFSLSGSAVAGVDYVQPLSPAYIGQSGYGVILIQTLPDPRAGSSRQAYDVVVTLEPGAGYALGVPS